jgi:hypothetical protein
LPEYQVNRLIRHLQEGEFLGKYGLYSIARRDSVHWDLIDSDWGGGGQYAGMPGRIARYLYQQGFAGKGWELLKRNMRYVDFFPYLPQNPRTDVPEQDRSSMPLQIAAGAGLEAIVFGVFGISMKENELLIRPFNHEDIGRAVLRNIRFKGHLISIELESKSFTVYKDNIPLVTRFYGESVLIDF